MQENIPIDPETGRIDESKLTDEQKQIYQGCTHLPPNPQQLHILSEEYSNRQLFSSA